MGRGLKRFEVEGFRQFKKPSGLNISGLNVIVGPNGSGKSTFTRLMRLMDEVVRKGQVRRVPLSSIIGHQLLLPKGTKFVIRLTYLSKSYGEKKVSLCYEVDQKSEWILVKYSLDVLHDKNWSLLYSWDYVGNSFDCSQNVLQGYFFRKIWDETELSSTEKLMKSMIPENVGKHHRTERKQFLNQVLSYLIEWFSKNVVFDHFYSDQSEFRDHAIEVASLNEIIKPRFSNISDPDPLNLKSSDEGFSWIGGLDKKDIRIALGLLRLLEDDFDVLFKERLKQELQVNAFRSELFQQIRLGLKMMIEEIELFSAGTYQKFRGIFPLFHPDGEKDPFAPVGINNWSRSDLSSIWSSSGKLNDKISKSLLDAISRGKLKMKNNIFQDQWKSEVLKLVIETSLDITNGEFEFRVIRNGIQINAKDLSVGEQRMILLHYLDEQVTFLEEPEASLHPSFQSNLGEEMTNAHVWSAPYNNMLSLVETHSEYFIRAIQLTIAKKLRDCKSNARNKVPIPVITYFNIEEDDTTTIKDMGLREDGMLSESFGPGFFDESVSLTTQLLQFHNNN